MDASRPRPEGTAWGTHIEVEVWYESRYTKERDDGGRQEGREQDCQYRIMRIECIYPVNR